MIPELNTLKSRTINEWENSRDGYNIKWAIKWSLLILGAFLLYGMIWMSFTPDL
jgi:hypothetical protein